MRAINGSCDASVSMHGERLLGVLIVSFSKRNTNNADHRARPYGRVLRSGGGASRPQGDLAPVDTELAKTTAVLYAGCIGAAQVQLFCQIQRQFLRALRFYDHAILLEGKTVPLLQLLV